MAADPRGSAATPPQWFVCCEDCGKAIVGESEEAIRGAVFLHKMDGCDD